MAERSSIFDMIGPIMIGPSSSHTAGVVRIGLVAHQLLGVIPAEAQITFYNSFASTFEGHGSDRAILAGLLGMHPDDDRIRTAEQEAVSAALQYSFRPVGNASTLHPNTVSVKALAASGEQVEVVGESLGGGVINIAEVDGYAANFSGRQPTLVIFADDRTGSIGFIANILAHDDCNIATMTCSRKAKNDMAALFIEIDTPARESTINYIRSLKWVHKVVYIAGI
jgi:L-serine dehydratase